jgi:hypothetical protein
MASPLTTWQPSRIIEPVEAFPTGTSVVRVKTDLGDGFLKALGNAAGPHALARELVGTMLARRFGLRTFDFSLIAVTGEEGVILGNNRLAEPGPAFITRAEDGDPWGGDAGELNLLDNSEDIARLVVFDTWTRNCDRYQPREGGPRVNRDNVFFSPEGASQGRFILKAIDHGHCFSCGDDLSERLGHLDHVRDDVLYGLFPEFEARVRRDGVLQAADGAEAVSRQEVERMIAAVPREWQVSGGVRQAWCELICQRARYVRTILDRRWPPPGQVDASSAAEGSDE